jgi:hypothetical protein
MFSQHFQRSPVFNDELLLGLVGVFGFAKPLRVARTKTARYRIRAFNIFNCSKKKRSLSQELVNVLIEHHPTMGIEFPTNVSPAQGFPRCLWRSPVAS